MDLHTWDPMYIISDTADLGGQPITAEYWNSLWALHRAQGDNTSAAVKQIVDDLYSGLWHAVTGAASLTNLEIYAGGATNVSGQLTELRDANDDVVADLLTEQVRIDNLLDGDLHAYTADRLGGQLPIYYATEAALSALEDVVAGLAAGTISAFSHNDISNRSVADAHPISAITGLQTTLTNLSNAIPTLHASFADRNAAASHTAAAVEYSTGVSVASKIANIDVVLASISGDVSSITHADLLLRNAADSHPTSAITGLDTALAAKQATITGAATTIDTENLTASRALVSDASGKVAVSAVTATELGYLAGVTSALQTQLNAKQKQVTASTSAPSGGSDGDVWIVYG